MDKGTFILAAGFTLVLGMYALNMTRADDATQTTSDNYAHRRQARQIAISGVSLAMQKFRFNQDWSSWIAEFQSRPLMGGTLTLTVDSTGLPSGQRRVLSEASYPSYLDTLSKKHRLVSVVHVPPADRSFSLSLLNVQSVIEMRGNDLSINSDDYLHNKFRVRGDSTYDLDSAKYGIGARSPSLTFDEVVDELTQVNARDSVRGVGSNPSVLSLSTVVHIDTLENAIQRAATITYMYQSLGSATTWGTLNSPAIVYVAGSLTIDNTLNGAGILFIDGSLYVKNTMNWSGYLIVRGSTLRVYSGSNDKLYLKGAVILGSETGPTIGTLYFRSRGVMEITYSPAILQMVRDKFPFSSAVRPALVRMYEYGDEEVDPD